MNKHPHLHISALALALLIIASLACGSATPQLVSTAPPATSASSSVDKPTSTTAAELPTLAALVDTPTSAAPDVFKVGDAVKIGDSVLMVLGWSEVEPTDFTKPDAGKKFVAVDVLIVNTSPSSASIASLLQISLKDDTGQKYDVDLMASVAAEKDGIDGELATGERVRGTTAFQVAEEAQGLQFVFDASVFGTGKVFIDLGETPVANEPPARVEGETEQPVFQVGETVQVGRINVTVNEVKTAEGNQFNQPDEGYQFLVVDVTVENTATEAAHIASALQMWLKDLTGQRYKVDLSATVASGGTAPDGELAAGEKLRGQVAYQVPEGMTGLLFVFDGEVFGTGKVSIALP